MIPSKYVKRPKVYSVHRVPNRINPKNWVPEVDREAIADWMVHAAGLHYPTVMDDQIDYQDGRWRNFTLQYSPGSFLVWNGKKVKVYDSTDFKKKFSPLMDNDPRMGL